VVNVVAGMSDYATKKANRIKEKNIYIARRIYLLTIRKFDYVQIKHKHLFWGFFHKEFICILLRNFMFKTLKQKIFCQSYMQLLDSSV